MVKFELVELADGVYIYHYYPEGDFDSKPGVIELNLAAESIELVELSEKDFEMYESAEEINSFIKTLNEMIAENGGTDFNNYVTTGRTRRIYADKAMSEIIERLNLENGKPPKSGMRAWY